MWENILVFAILALAAGLTTWKFYKSFTGKSPCCGGGCSCKGSCPPGGSTEAGLKGLDGHQMKQLSESGSCCSR